jgi:PIN domain
MSGANVTSQGGGLGGVPRVRDAYLTWVEEVEAALVSMTEDPEVLSLLYTPQYWRIRELESDWKAISDPRPYPLVYSAVGRQTELLERIAKELEQRLARTALAASGPIAVLDTNVLLQYQGIDQIPWEAVLGLPAVRLVIPVRVVEEIDAKKYAKQLDLAKRARNLLPVLAQYVGPAGAPGALKGDVTIEVFIETGPRARPEDADEEILTTCLDLAQFSSKPITLVTADYGMRLRAEAYGISTASLPDNYLRRRVETESQQPNGAA